MDQPIARLQNQLTLSLALCVAQVPLPPPEAYHSDPRFACAIGS